MPKLKYGDGVVVKKCIVCEKDFKVYDRRGRKKVICSDECRIKRKRALDRIGVKPIMRKCVECGTGMIFPIGRRYNNIKICSDGCRKVRENRQAREYKRRKVLKNKKVYGGSFMIYQGVA